MPLGDMKGYLSSVSRLEVARCALLPRDWPACPQVDCRRRGRHRRFIRRAQTSQPVPSRERALRG